MTKVLIVEDEKGLRRVLRELLDCLGFLVDEAEDGVRALDYLAEQAELPDVIMSDLNMPHMGGLELLRQIKQSTQWKHIPVIIVSGSAGDEQKVLEAGAMCFLLKPFTLNNLEDAFIDFLS